MSATSCALLLVSDSGLRASLAAALTAEGLPTDGVGGAAAAGALLAARRYDAVVAELNPADPDGPRVLAALACRSDRPVFVVLTTAADPRLVRCVTALRPDEIVLPPIEPAGVAAKTARLVALFGDADELAAGDAAADEEMVNLSDVLPESVPPTSPVAAPVKRLAARPMSGEAPAPGAMPSRVVGPGGHAGAGHAADLTRTVPGHSDPLSRSACSPASGVRACHPAVEAPASSEAGSADGAAAKAVVAIRLADRARGRELAALLAAENIAAAVTDTTDELHELLSRDRVDLVVIDNRLPGFLTGLDVLEMFHKELLRPDAVLLTDRRERDAERLRALQPARLLPPTTELDKVAEAARSVLARRKSAGLFVNASARRLVAECETVRPMPQLLVKLVGYLAMDATEIPVPQLSRDVAADPKATAELLRFTNSSAVCRRRRVTGVSDAVTLLGPRRVVALFLSGAAVASAGDLLRGWSEPMQAWYHRRSVLNAAAAQAFARLEGVSPDTAFLLGLLQDLGIAVLAETGGERYAQIVERVCTVPLLRLDRLEGAAFGCTHADVSAALLQRWGLPTSLVGPVLAHHADDGLLSKTERGFVWVMRIAEAIADLADCQCPQRRQTLNRLLAAFGPAERATCPAAVAEAVAGAVEASTLFALPAPDADTLRRLEAEVAAAREATDGDGQAA